MGTHEHDSSAVKFSRCKNCAYWVSSVDQPRGREAFLDGEGECRRRAPVGGGITAYFALGKRANRMIATMYPWPIAHEGDWCGEFEPVGDRESSPTGTEVA